MSTANLKFMIRHVHPKGSVESSHVHSGGELVYYIRGEGKSVIADKEYCYSSATYAYIPPGTPHLERHETQTEVLFFVFDYDDDFMQIKGGVFRDDGDEILPLFEELSREIVQKRIYYEYAINIDIERIIIAISRKQNPETDQSVLRESMKFAADYIRQNAHMNVDIHMLADMVGYSYDYFRHRFVEFFGIGAKEYILKERLNKVKDYLVNTDLPVGEIAKRCAFSGAAHLSVAFREKEGITPQKYRRDALSSGGKCDVYDYKKTK